MSDLLTHECGLALVRLRRGLTYYGDRYGDPAWGLRQLYLLMEKQHNRGQDGAGLAVVRLDMPPGEEYLKRLRSDRHNAIERIFDVVMRDIHVRHAHGWEGLGDTDLKRACEYLGELYLGHLRYATYATQSKLNCHPYVRRSNTAGRNLAIAGNFNMTNATELFNQLVADGLSPVGESDTLVILERIGYFLDREYDCLSAAISSQPGRLDGRELAHEVSNELDLVGIIRKASEDWDGGYMFVGLVGNGDAFVVRDANGIRPGFFYVDDEVVAAASERAALASVFNVDVGKIEAIKPGHVLEVKRDGRIRHEPFTEPRDLRECTFERIYFSRGNDPDIYRERKALGRNLAPRVLAALGGDVRDAVFSFIPNTAESAYMGLVERLEDLIRQRSEEELWEAIRAGKAQRSDLERLRGARLRTEKIAHKDQRLRTFITHDAARRDLVVHIYDITRGIITPGDTLVVLDDSIVRGTTLRESIITILSRLNPARIIIASSAPPIMYPDCYGIDMSQLGRFIAFEATVALLHERGEERLCDEVEERCLAQADRPAEEMRNEVKALYDRFTLEEISAKVAELVRPRDITWKGTVDVIYQDIEGLQSAIPGHTGDWFFTGRYPTPGGYRVLNTSYLNWRRNRDVRAY
jgi:amidophosphoribosyltransferase